MLTRRRRSWSFASPTLLPLALVLAAHVASAATVSTAEPTEKSGVGAQAIALPQGAGKVDGMGESFSMQLSTGAAMESVPVKVPAGRGGIQPSLAFAYASSGGRGVAGQGWSIGAPSIARQTDRGIPRYADPPAGSGWTPSQDRFVTSGGQELVPIGLVTATGCAGALPGEVMPSWAVGWQYFRPAIEGEFARYFWSPDRRTWRVQAKSGASFEYGVPLDGTGDTNALEADPAAPSRVFRWNLARTYDAHGDVNGAVGDAVRPVNVARYRYVAGNGLSYLSDVYDTPPASGGDAAPLASWAHHVHLAYETRPDVTRSYKRGYLAVDDRRVTSVDVTSATFGGSGPRELVRRYHATYDAAYHVSLLTRVQEEGRCAQPVAEDASGLLPPVSGCPTLPPLTFSYSHVAGVSDLAGYEAFDETPHVMAGSPRLTTDGQRADFFDVDADGLPDVLATDTSSFGTQVGVFFAGASGDADTFTAGTAAIHGVLNDTSASLTLGNATVVPLDLDGDGVVDLLHMPRTGTYALYTPRRGAAGWALDGRVVTTADAQSPLIDFTGNALRTRTMDVNGDGLLDVVVTNGGAYQTFFGLGRYPGGDGQLGTARWTGASTAAISTQTPAVTCMPWSSVAVQLGDPDQKIADMNGDGLPDVVRVRPNDVRYWPGRGNGYWGTGSADDCPKGTIASGRDLAMSGSPNFPGAPGLSMRLRDVNGDGLDDLVQIRSNAVDVWLNVDGVGFTAKPHTIVTTAAQPNLQANARMRFLDVNGSGTTDLVWGEGWRYAYVDLAGGTRPWLLTRVTNGLGKTTDLTYAASTTLMLAARKAGAPWASVTPSPIHVLTGVTERDTLAMLGRAPAVYTRTYTYRDPVYDGRAREFRGFRSVHVDEAGNAGTPALRIDTTFALGECAPDPNDPGASPCSPQGAWRANPREALKGLPLWTEKSDEAGRVLSSEHTTYRLRRLYVGQDGRDVRHAASEASDRYLYDVAAFTPAPSALAVTDVNLEIDGVTTPIAGTGVARASYAHLRSSSTYDVFGNSTGTTDEGCIEGCRSTDEALVTTVRNGLAPGDASGWTYRPLESWKSGTRHAGRAYRHVRTTYDALGQAVATEAELTGTLPLDRHHEDPTAAIAPAPPRGSVDGWIPVVSSTYDAFGNVVATRTANGRCHRVSFEPAFAELAVTETVLVGAPGADGCGTTALSAAATYDRGFGAATLEIDVHGEMTTIAYDGFGRIVEMRKPDPAQAGLVDPYPSETYEYVLPSDGAAMPWSLVHVVTHDAPDVAREGTTEGFIVVDAFGRTVAKIAQADPAEGDAAPWTVSGATEYDRDGRPRRVWRSWFYAGDPRALPLQTTAPDARATETRYDAFGRVVETYALDGALVGRTLYHALSTDALDAADLQPDATPTPATTVKDGHGRDVAIVERLHAGAGIEAHTTTTTYSPAGDVESIARTSDGTAAVIVRAMQYDSLGRRVLNVEPNTSQGAWAPGQDPSAVRAFRYAYDDDGDVVGTSDARGCGVNFTFDGAGRLLGEDDSPCLRTHAPYSAPDATTGAGYEVRYTYDAAPPDAPASLASGFFAGRLAAVADRASESVSSYDARGRLVASARRLARPDGTGYTARWYTQTTAFDARDRPTRVTTGAASPELLGDDGASAVTTTYAKSGHPARVAGSYGTIVRGVTHDAAGLVTSIAYGDAAQTTTASTFDARDRLAHTETRRVAPAAWTASPPAYSPAPTHDAPSTLQLLLAAGDLTYDALDRPIAIHDGRDPAEWPAGAKPVDRTMQYDDLGRLLRVDYAYAGGADAWTSPTAAEEAGSTRQGGAMPRASFAARPAWQSFAYDAFGNVTASRDDANGFYDRSLGDATYGSPAAGPYQLRTATGAASGAALAAVYDAAGNTTSLVVRRPGACVPAGAHCNHRFAYDWDEVGRLVRARRWDLDDPGAPSDPVPTATPAADLRYAYDGTEARVLTAATDAAGVTRYRAYLSPSLELRETTFDGDDFVRDATTEVVTIAAHGVRLGEVRTLPEDAPTATSGRRHVLQSIPDFLRSNAVTIDHETGELVEASSYLPYGAKETDYRPERWSAYRAPYGFTGKEEDLEVGLTYFGKRFLAPALLRWMSPDPLAIHALKADMNVYAYVHGKVFVAVDPTGLDEASGGCRAGSDITPSVSKDPTITPGDANSAEVNRLSAITNGRFTEFEQDLFAGYTAQFGRDSRGGLHALQSITPILRKSDAGVSIAGYQLYYGQSGLHVISTVSRSGDVLSTSTGETPLESTMFPWEYAQIAYGGVAILRAGAKVTGNALAAETRALQRAAVEKTTVDLYRAVGVREFKTVTATGRFAPGANSLEGRQFAFTLEEALKYADTDPSKVAILKATVERDALASFDFSKSIDPHIFKNGVITVQPGAQSEIFHKALVGIEHAF